MNELTIGQLANQTGVGVETVRFYERKGLIGRPPRPHAGYRRYSQEIIDRILFIRQAQDLGFSLREIRELLSLRVDPRTSCAEVKRRAEGKIVDINHKIELLKRMRGALVKVTASCSGEGPTSECPILEAMTPVRRVPMKGGAE